MSVCLFDCVLRAERDDHSEWCVVGVKCTAQACRSRK